MGWWSSKGCRGPQSLPTLRVYLLVPPLLLFESGFNVGELFQDQGCPVHAAGGIFLIFFLHLGFGQAVQGGFFLEDPYS